MENTSKLLTRFYNKTELLQNGCVVWIGADDGTNRYGRFWLKNKLISAHRASYLMFVGDIPDGMTVDHICQNTKCVNSLHLRLLTQKDNVLAGNGLSAKNKRKTHCNRGHKLAGSNLLVSVGGKRTCKTCLRLKQREYKERKLNVVSF